MMIRLCLWLLWVCYLALVTTEALAGKPGGGGTTPPPPLPDVRYEVKIIPTSSPSVWVNEINDAGIIVGRFASRAFIYDQPGDITYNLNDFPELLSQLDIKFGSDWIFNSAVGINNFGQVVGRVENLITLRTEGFAMDTFLDPNPSAWLVRRLPPVPGDHSYARRINIHGQVLGSYKISEDSDERDCFVCNPWDTNPTAIPFGLTVNSDNIGINNYGVVAGVLQSGLTFYGTSSNIQTVNGITNSIRFGGINDYGIMSVSAYLKINNKRQPLSTYRVSDSLEKVLENGHPWGMNQDGDIAINLDNGIPKLAYNGSTALNIPKQVLSITDLIPDSDPMKSTLVNNNPFWLTTIGNRNSTGFGQLAGSVRTSNGDIGVVLTPYVPVP
jgi:hypothetical protein